jgi:hypothetical protein
LKAYKHEQIVVGKDVFHKIGCFKCYFCSEPLKLWSYNVLDGNYYCGAHYQQFVAKINAKKQLEASSKAIGVELYKEQLVKEEEERLRKEAEEEARRREMENVTTKEEEELQRKREELARQVEEMRKMLEEEEKETLPALISAPSTPTTTKKTRVPSSKKTTTGKTATGEEEEEEEYEYEEVEEEYEEEEEEEYELVEVEEEEEEEVDSIMDSVTKSFFDAVKSGNESLVGELLTKNPNLASASNGEEETPLHFAMNSKNVTIMKLLLERKVDILKRTKVSGKKMMTMSCFFISPSPPFLPSFLH